MYVDHLPFLTIKPLDARQKDFTSSLSTLTLRKRGGYLLVRRVKLSLISMLSIVKIIFIMSTILTGKLW